VFITKEYIEKKGIELLDDVIFYKENEMYIFYHRWSDIAIFVHQEASAEDFVQAVITTLKESPWALKYIKIILQQMAYYIEFIPYSNAKKLSDYAVAALMVME
jgi:hypothetical protein